MADLLKGDLVRHAAFGIGRVEETAKGGGPDRGVFFPRLDKQALVSVADLQPLSDAEATAYEMVRLAVTIRSISRSTARWRWWRRPAEIILIR